MGKYSLDAFETYPLVKLRPPMAAPGDTSFTLISSPAEARGNGPFVLRPELPGGPDAACAALAQMTCIPSGNVRPDAVVASGCGFPDAALPAIAKAYLQGFPGIPLLSAPDDPLMAYLPDAGLWLEPDWGILPLRLAIARNRLERRWRQHPVYARTASPLTEEVRQALVRWHCTACNMPGPWGPQMALRRLMFPRDLTAGAEAPFRMWWQNLGTAPLYGPANALLFLEKNGRLFPLTGNMPVECHLGDTTCNPLLTLPELPDGEYALLCALEFGGKRLPLSMKVPNRDGLYSIGAVHLDHIPRPYLRTMWQAQYADGYYPLEDPAAPEEGGTL